MKELLIRSATGLVFGSLLLGSLLLHPFAFLGVYLLVTVLCLNEYLLVSKNEDAKPLHLPVLLIVALAFIVRFFHHYSNLSASFLLIPLSLIIFLYIIELFRKERRPFLNIAIVFLGLIYVGVPMILFNELVYNPYSNEYSPQLLFFLLVVIWLNDTGAYFIGRLLGKNKLFERISPKKTWEGLIGGLVIAFIVTGLFGKFYTEIPRLHQWLITGIIVIFGTFGDLTESLWKRSIGLKDSGNALPGHGGWLDRLDSILFAVPAVVITINLLNSF